MCTVRNVICARKVAWETSPPGYGAPKVRCRASTQTYPTSCLLLRPGFPSMRLRSQFPPLDHLHIHAHIHTSLYLSPPLSTSLSTSLLLHTENQSSCYCNAHHHSSCYCIFSQNGYSFSINSSQVPHGPLLFPHRRRSHAPHSIASVTLYSYNGGRQPEVITFHTRAHKPNRCPASVSQVSLRRKPVSTPRSVERQVKTLPAELAQVQHRSLYCHPQEGTRAWSV